MRLLRLEITEANMDTVLTAVAHRVINMIANRHIYIDGALNPGIPKGGYNAVNCGGTIHNINFQGGLFITVFTAFKDHAELGMRFDQILQVVKAEAMKAHPALFEYRNSPVVARGSNDTTEYLRDPFDIVVKRITCIENNIRNLALALAENSDPRAFKFTVNLMIFDRASVSLGNKVLEDEINVDCTIPANPSMQYILREGFFPVGIFDKKADRHGESFVNVVGTIDTIKPTIEDRKIDNLPELWLARIIVDGQGVFSEEIPEDCNFVDVLEPKHFRGVNMDQVIDHPIYMTPSLGVREHIRRTWNAQFNQEHMLFRHPAIDKVSMFWLNAADVAYKNVKPNVQNPYTVMDTMFDPGLYTIQPTSKFNRPRCFISGLPVAEDCYVLQILSGPVCLEKAEATHSIEVSYGGVRKTYNVVYVDYRTKQQILISGLASNVEEFIAALDAAGFKTTLYRTKIDYSWNQVADEFLASGLFTPKEHRMVKHMLTFPRFRLDHPEFVVCGEGIETHMFIDETMKCTGQTVCFVHMVGIAN
jgi:hypothetical protein